MRSLVPFLHLDRAAYSLDHAAELDEDAVAGALEAPIVQGDGRINQFATQRAEPRQCAILVHAGKSAVNRSRRRRGITL